jgi:uncharacterized membrane protein
MSNGSQSGASGGRLEGNGWALGIDASTSPTPAVRGRERGRVGWIGGTDGTGLATALGIFSVALGLAQLAAPRGVARLSGIRPTTRTIAIMRVAGVREIGHGVGILANPRSKEWVGTRIAGDVLDLALLGVVLARGSDRSKRTFGATAAVLGVTALDVLCTEELSESRKAPHGRAFDDPEIHIHRSITIGRAREDVYRFWRDLENLPRFMPRLEWVRDLGGGRSRWAAMGPAGPIEWEAEITRDRENELIAWRSLQPLLGFVSGNVSFSDAPAGRGTIVTVEMRYAPPGGRIGSAMLKMVRREPGQQIGDDLRRLKQIMETGEVVFSDATAVPRLHSASPPAARRARRWASERLADWSGFGNRVSATAGQGVWR